ncbi:MAG TPA: alpha/beta fold hydrolase [Solirubrobacteraceae bacterium]|nr:alpha/beta fold hydrolase [Solirubrobacteraceae bacterium]
MTRHVPGGPVTTSRRGSFWVGVSDRVDGPLGTVLRGPVYVEWEAPASSSGPPWVLVHGGGGQGTDYLTTPDGRLGWSRLLVQQGHTVYVVDRPGHGRSPFHPDVLGPMGPQMGAQALRPIFVPPPEGEDSNPWARLHTQWPGGREPGDPIYDQWLAPSGPMLASWPDMHALEQARLAELLDVVGPAVLVTHSAAGPGTFLAADARPDAVAALIAIEVVPEDPPRQLPNLTRFPIAVVTGEASMFRAFDQDLVSFLEQAGCDVELIQLADHGVHGNSHGIMIERNNAETLAVLTRWVASRLGS